CSPIKCGPFTFQCACFICIWRSTASARRWFTSTLSFNRSSWGISFSVLYTLSVPLDFLVLSFIQFYFLLRCARQHRCAAKGRAEKIHARQEFLLVGDAFDLRDGIERFHRHPGFRPAAVGAGRCPSDDAAQGDGQCKNL